MESYHRSLSLVEAPDPYRYVHPEGSETGCSEDAR